MTVHWLVQTNLGPTSGIETLLQALRDENTPYTEVAPLPMSEDMPEAVIDPTMPVLVYGTTSLVSRVARDRPWAPGVFFDPARFTYAAWAEHYGEHLLNSPDETIRTTLTEALKLVIDDEYVFVRPERDLKEFNGGIQKTTDFVKWTRDVVEAGGYPLIDGQTPVVIGKPHGISNEWRVFISDRGEILGSSQYQRQGRSEWLNNTPDEVLAFARARALEWSPAPVFVMDVARSGTGLFIVEAQCAHSAGFYAMPMRPFVQGMNRVVERWAKTNAPHRSPKPAR